MLVNRDSQQLRRREWVKVFIRTTWSTRKRITTKDRRLVRTGTNSSPIHPPPHSTLALTLTTIRECLLTRPKYSLDLILRESLTTWVNTEFQGHQNQTGRIRCRVKIKTWAPKGATQCINRALLIRAKDSRSCRSWKSGHKWLFTNCLIPWKSCKAK